MSEQTETMVEEAVEASVTSSEVEATSETTTTPEVEANLAEVAEEANMATEAASEAVTEATAEAVVPETGNAEVAAASAQVENAVADTTAEVAEAAEAVTETASEPVAEAAEQSAVAPETVVDTAVAETVEAAPTAEAGSSEAAASEDSEDAGDDASGKRVVRVLSVGQEVEGLVKRITEFGAFVDIGVGRDGLLHVSELSLQRVAKVSDVLKQGQEITVWIKELDRERNRISLTMISPDTKTIRDLEQGEIVEGTVSRIMPYGAFIDIGVGRDALLHVREMSDGFVKRPEDVVTIGETIEARIVAVSRRRQRIDLSLKGLRSDPEAEAAQDAAEAAEEVAEDLFENVEVLSPMELAFKRAMEGSDAEASVPLTKQQSKRGKNRRPNSRAIQDEIIARTLGSSTQK